MISQPDVERLAQSDAVRAAHTTEHLHRASVELGSDEFDDAWLKELAATRPGAVPWGE